MKRLISVLVALFILMPNVLAKDEKIKFWNEQRKGANWFNKVPTKDWLIAAKATGIEIVRLAPNNWKSEQKHFLIGDADHFEAIVEQDFIKLKEVLDQADAVGIKVVLTMLSLPGAVNRQANGGKPDFRLWKDARYLPQATAFWKDLARRLKNHKAVVGYNILNEPVPERATGFGNPRTQDIIAWYEKIRNTPADLNAFNETIVRAIREVDKETPIIIDCGFWASTQAIRYLKPLGDKKIIYAVHMYEPYEYTNRKANNGRYVYPGKVLSDAGGGKQVSLNLNYAELESELQPVVDWQKQYKIPSNRIFLSEFGCNRMVGGAVSYLGDLIKIFNKNEWHWAFFTFRQDSWDGMDYEIGTKPLKASYWEAVDRGETPQVERTDNPLWEVIKKELKP